MLILVINLQQYSKKMVVKMVCVQDREVLELVV